MSKSVPITAPPIRRDILAQVQDMFSNTLPSGDYKSFPKKARKLEPHHHALLESGCQSAKSSPLPHRRLDKLEGVIRESPKCSTCRPFAISMESKSYDSPIFLSKGLNNGSIGFEPRMINNHQESPMPCRKSLTTDSRRFKHGRISSDCSYNSAQTYFEEDMVASVMRRRVGSDCSAKSVYRELDIVCSPQLHRKCSQPVSVLGEPGCFSSPIHQTNTVNGSSARTALSDSAAFVHNNVEDENGSGFLNRELEPDRNIISGWLKFRDNKRVSENLRLK